MMKDIPQKMNEVINNSKLRQTAAEQPGSLRLKATVLGLAALAQIKNEANPPNPSLADADILPPTK